MADYDGEIRINTKISIAEAKMNLRQLKAELASAGREIERQQKNLAKLAPKLAEYGKVKDLITASRDRKLSSAIDDSQRDNANAAYASQMATLDASYADVLQLQQQYNAALDAAVQKQSELNIAVAQAQAAGAAEADQARAAKDAAAAKKEQVALEREQARAAKEAAAEEARLSREAERAQSNMAQSAKSLARSILKWGTAMLCVRGVIGMLRKSVSAFLSDNQDVANQLSAIWSAIGNALAPIITRIIGLIQTLFAAISAFVKALTGVDLIANYNAKALDKQADATAGAGAAAEKAERQLAGFDEMNKLTDTSSSSGGGGGGGSVETPTLLDGGLSDKLQSQVVWLAAHFEDILWYAGAIGAAVAAWKIASMFTSDLQTIAGLAVAVGGAVLYIKGLLDALENGIDYQNMIEMFAGAMLVIAGIGIAFGPVAAAVAAIATAVGLLVVGIKDFIETGELTYESCAVISTGLLLIGGAIAVLTGSFIPLIIAAVAAVLLTLNTYWAEINEWFDEIDHAVYEWLEEVWKKIVEFFSGLVQKCQEIKQSVVEKFDEIKRKVLEKVSELKQKAVEKFQELKEKAVQKITEIKQKASGIFSSITETISGAIGKAREKFEELKQKALEVWETIKNKFTSIGSIIGNAISGAIKTAINGVLSKIENTVNKAIRIINSAIRVINLLPGVSVGYVSAVSLPRLARGGIVNNPGMGVPAVIGEAGKEAVLPLERNTEWMDTLAEKLASKVGANGQTVIPVYLSGKKIAEYIIDMTTKRAFATNNA